MGVFHSEPLPSQSGGLMQEDVIRARLDRINTDLERINREVAQIQSLIRVRNSTRGLFSTVPARKPKATPFISTARSSLPAKR